MKPAILIVLAACTLADKNQCVDSSDCVGGNVCTSGTCQPQSASIVGDWFGELPDPTRLDNDGVHFADNGMWVWLRTISNPGPEDNSRLDPDESYCEAPSSGVGNYTITGADLFGTPDDGTIISITEQELVIANGT